jgi:predicted MFS family arabinose efflux permease
MSLKIVPPAFIPCFLGQFAFSSVFFMLLPTIPIYLARLGMTEAGIGVQVGALSVSSLILRPLVGRALLKIPERNFMMAGAVIFALSSVTYLVAKPFWPLFMLRVFQGIGLAFFATAAFTFITRISPEAHRGQTFGYFYLSINTAFALAPIFGLFVMNRFDFTVFFLICTGFSLFSLFVIQRIGKAQGVPTEDPSPRPPLLCREAIPPAIVSSMGNMGWGAVMAFFPLYALQRGVANPGLFFAVYAAILILGRGLGGKILDYHTRERVILPCLAIQSTAMVILSQSTTMRMFIVVAVVWGMGNAFLYPSLVAYTLDQAGSLRGPAMGTYLALADLGTGLGSVIMGAIIQWTDYPTMFLCLALTGLINLLYFNISVRRKEVRYADL